MSGSAASFPLKYQESMSSSGSGSTTFAGAGTQTCTRQQREQTDSDQWEGNYRPLPAPASVRAGRGSDAPSMILLSQEVMGGQQLTPSVTAGTQTKSGTRESTDQDRQSLLAAATQTITESREGRDQDRSDRGYHLLPRDASCS